MSKNDPFFEILTLLNCTICVTVTYWEIITQIKHPIMKGQEKLVQETLSQPDEIRRSRSDPNVYLFYQFQRPKRWLCAIIRKLNGDGFLITTYPTDAIKEGEILWQK
ncbi:MAG: DUF4258 domain-containing protein [Microcystis aeruginosa K13-05]|jgi:hypothetical protein|uniref:DUF4258 domain-containing protein n=1 Tax=unclassified Microcystis TaxID=2643300 RepID=UPI0025894C97|nr:MULTISPECIES: DUF4258 domain-containing protein [unclassified Microcystis]MDJ0545868.1 DUF4258 domain-containing protein [Microcystis sp. M53601_WE4]NCR82836.1 DUF4258 domain-containing protein [Microcystis aeruginosa K13-10]NCR87523.1 DUF4258 domain-containing protein [Microcystis aeruginosa K13-05]MDJ0539055.1 DUF4258 domain-containing protein [Microcystis sp. M53603_WE2]MDJ0606421.1 DUF4258 domain-containing protein [Microcystis sp. M53602_WE12]